MTLHQMKQQLERKKGQAEIITKDMEKAEEAAKDLKVAIKDTEKAQAIIQTVAQKTQEELEYRLSEVVTLALASVFDNPYELKINFTIRRGKTECDILFVRDGNEFQPGKGTGGGACDIASFALRVAVWKLSQPHSRNVLILDEPFKHLKGAEANKRAIQMVKMISEELNIQIISVSDERAALKDIKDGADKVFVVSKKKETSIVKEAA